MVTSYGKLTALLLQRILKIFEKRCLASNVCTTGGLRGSSFYVSPRSPMTWRHMIRPSVRGRSSDWWMLCHGHLLSTVFPYNCPRIPREEICAPPRLSLDPSSVLPAVEIEDLVVPLRPDREASSDTRRLPRVSSCPRPSDLSFRPPFLE